MSTQAGLSEEPASEPSLATLLLPFLTHNSHLRSPVVLLQVEWIHESGDWASLRTHMIKLLTRSIRAGSDLLLPAVGGETRESFFILASTDLQHAQIMLRRIRERLSGLPDLVGSVTVSARCIWLPTRSPETSFQELTAQVAEQIARLTKLGENP